MEFQKIVNLLDTTPNDKYLPRFVTEKLIKVHDQSEKKYRVTKEIRMKTPMLRSNLCDLMTRILLWKELLLLLIQIMQKEIKQ